MGTEKFSVHRRHFLGIAAALSAPLIIPRHVLGDEKTPSANEKIVVGHIGIGKQMRGHVAAATRSPKVKVVAVCDVDKTRRLAGKKQVDDAYHNNDCTRTTITARCSPAATSTPSFTPRPTTGTPWSFSTPEARQGPVLREAADE